MKARPEDFTCVRIPLIVRSPYIHIRRRQSRRTLCGLGLLTRPDLVNEKPTCGTCVLRAAKLMAQPKESELEVEAARLIAAAGLPEPVRQFALGAGIGRKWTIDFAWPAQRVALEVDGGGIIHRKVRGRVVMIPGRHNSDEGREDDAVRDAFARLSGWLLFRASPRLLRQGYAVRWIRAALELRAGDAYSPDLPPSMFPTAAVLRPQQHARKLARQRRKHV